MLEIYGDMWDVASNYDAVCITTNGYVKSNGEAVMGRGCALEAARRWPYVPGILGARLHQRGNVVTSLMQVMSLVRTAYATVVKPIEEDYELVSFPVKHRWMDKADIGLIEQSTEQLVDLANESPRLWKNVLLPRPGCGNGHLRWADVKPVIEPLLDDRFTVITRRRTDR